MPIGLSRKFRELYQVRLPLVIPASSAIFAHQLYSYVLLILIIASAAGVFFIPLAPISIFAIFSTAFVITSARYSGFQFRRGVCLIVNIISALLSLFFALTEYFRGIWAAEGSETDEEKALIALYVFLCVFTLAGVPFLCSVLFAIRSALLETPSQTTSLAPGVDDDDNITVSVPAASQNAQIPANTATNTSSAVIEPAPADQFV